MTLPSELASRFLGAQKGIGVNKKVFFHGKESKNNLSAEHERERASKTASERASEQASERASERNANESEQMSERASERATCE